MDAMDCWSDRHIVPDSWIGNLTSPPPISHFDHWVGFCPPLCARFIRFIGGSVMDVRRSTLSVLALCLTMGAASPAIAETACRWEGSQLRCERNQDDSDFERYDREYRDRNGRYRRDRNDYDRRGSYRRGSQSRRDRDYDRDYDYDNDYYRRGSSRYRLASRVDSVYRSVLGRSADRRGLATYIDRIEDDGWDLRRIRRDLAGSREASTAIDRAYREILGRSVDRDGLRTYRNRLQSGWSLNRIRQELANSREARNRYRR